ncbi:MAG: prolipoprotein diacylglyceryl transferase [Clostridia bacterium]|nr:prolipoprotein diacylglyceryl transferase [Clostridia bacterium]
MYNKTIFLDMDLYSIFLLVGVLTCLIFIRVLADRRKMRAAWQNLTLFNAVFAVLLGYGGAVLFQAFYNFMDDGVFVIANNTGATFYGGLIGGTAMFIIIYFIVGRFLFKDGYHIPHLRTASDMAAPCIAVAHGFGRLGCLMAGCCHGARTDAWYGIPMDIPGDGTDALVRVIPVQLYEAIFLFALSAVTFVLFWRGKKYLLPLYMVTYGIWRFIAEYLRADDRGATVVDFWSPSQLISVLLISGGLVLWAIELYVDHKKKTAGQKEGPAVSEDEISDGGVPDEAAEV